jgi:hypothetical protein
VKHVHFGIVLDGKRWHGDWSIDGTDIVIRSAYGTRRVPPGRAKPELKAARVLKEMVEAWRNRAGG